MRRGKVSWTGGSRFRGETGGHEVVMHRKTGDGPSAGPSPKDLTLLSLGGCALVNIVDILGKMRQPVESIEVDMETKDTEEVPKIFDGVTLVFKLSGAGLDTHKARRAVQLAMDQYCAVSAMLSKATPIHWRVEVNGQPVE